MPKPKSVQVLLTAGERPARILMERELPAAGKLAVAIKDGEDLSDLVASRDLDVVRLDLEPPGGEGERPLRLVRGSGHAGEVVVLDDGMVASESAPLDDEVYGFLTRPLSPAELRRLAEEADGAARAPSRRRPGGAAGAAILGQSPAILGLLERAERIADAPASVLVQGETGTGKTLVARMLHEASRRREKPFVVVNCSAFQDQLLESELFGHEKGAFTGAVAAKPGLFEVAHGGTLFLDEVAEMSPAMQAKLLGVLDSGELRRVGGTRSRRVEVRVVSASNKELAEEVRAGRFREDLLFRLNVVSLAVPPLRERREDVPELIEHFLARFRPPGGPPKEISPAALQLLAGYRWPGNVRELANTIEGLVLLAPGPVIRARDLPPGLRPAGDLELESADAPLPMTEIERLHIARTLRYTEGKKAPAARLLGIDIKTLNKKIKSYRIAV